MIPLLLRLQLMMVIIMYSSKENSGTIQRNIHIYATGAWSVDTTKIVATNAKLHSPLSAIYIPAIDSADYIDRVGFVMH